jgi:hypothetical protein
MSIVMTGLSPPGLHGIFQQIARAVLGEYTVCTVEGVQNPRNISTNCKGSIRGIYRRRSLGSTKYFNKLQGQY